MKQVFLLLMIVFNFDVRAQPIKAGLLPEITLSHSLNDNWRVTSKLATMHSLFDNQPTGDFKHNHIQSDAQFFIGYNLRPLWNIAWGYHYLYIGEHAHRTIQQVSFVDRKNRMRLAHRGRLDATIYEKQTPRLRLRYRFSAEIPLSGFTLDPNEFYTLFSLEPIALFQSNNIDLENRLGASIGRQLKHRGKLELGLDYRTRNMLSNKLNHRMLLRFAWFLSI